MGMERMGKVTPWRIFDFTHYTKKGVPVTARPSFCVKQIGIYRTKAFPWGKVDFPFCPEEGQNGKDG